MTELKANGGLRLLEKGAHRPEAEAVAGRKAMAVGEELAHPLLGAIRLAPGYEDGVGGVPKRWLRPMAPAGLVLGFLGSATEAARPAAAARRRL
jgi:hypothetical protein